jgi:V8-like Glu-specific endopeptidase
MLRYAIMFLLLVSSVGCAPGGITVNRSVEESRYTIVVGESSDSVRAVLGSPMKISKSDQGEIWHYCDTGILKSYDSMIALWIQNGTVIDKTSYQNTRFGDCSLYFRGYTWGSRPNREYRLGNDTRRNSGSRKDAPNRAATKPEQNPTPRTKSAASGSGFFVSKLGHIITNQHVVKSCKRLTVGDNAKTQVKAEVVETDKRNDLALLKISSTEMASEETKSLIRKLGTNLSRDLGIKVVPLSSNGLLRSEDVELGESLLVAGYPYGEIFSNTIKVTKGIVSAIRGIGDDSGQFQMDAAVQPGNSGGPVYDSNGNIVGVVVAQLNKLKVAKAIGSLPENVNFGIKASTVRQFLTSAGLPTKWSSRTQSMSTRDLAKIAKNQTVMVVCQR